MKNNNGITLVALVISIIVLLILTGVSISVVVGDNGIISQATYASEITNKNAKDEKKQFEDVSDYIDEKYNNSNEPDFSDLLEIKGCPLKFGRAYLYTDDGAWIGLLPFTDGACLVGWPAFGWASDSVDYFPAGTLTYDGCNILFENTTIATCNAEGTEVYYDSLTFTFEPVLLGTNDFCSHNISRSEAKHHIKTYMVGETNIYTGDAYCVYCKELVKTGTCKHIHIELQNMVEATCSTEGYTGDTVCLDCKKVISRGSITNALGHVDTNKDNKCDACNWGCYPSGTFVFGTDGNANLYGDNYSVISTYTGWNTATYTSAAHAPWNNKRTSIQNVIIENGITIKSMDYWFINCKNLNNIKINNNITSIGKYCFANCSNLKNIEIPDSVTAIEDYAFSNCGITKIILHQNISSLGKYAFNSCTEISSISIPSNITYINISAFRGCSNLLNVVFEGNLKYIGDNAFENCNKLNNITLPQSITRIGSDAFQNCESLTTFKIPYNVTSVGWDAFKGCTSLTSIIFENTSGWNIYELPAEDKIVSNINLTNPTTNVIYFTKTYIDKQLVFSRL